MAVLSRSAKPRPMLTNYSYRYQLRDQKCRNTLPRWFTDANHNKDKTNISLSSHVSLWGLSACLCTASMKGSHLLLFPLSSKWNKAFCLLPRTKPFKLRLPRRNVYYQVSIWASHLAQRIGPNSTIFLCGSVFFLFFFFELWFWWKTPESEDSLISHAANEGERTTSCHYWKRKRQKVWATSKNEGWFTFFTYISSFLILRSLLQRVSLTGQSVFSVSDFFSVFYNHFEWDSWCVM